MSAEVDNRQRFGYARKVDPDDPDDDAVPAPASTRTGTAGDVDEAMRLLTWARKQGFAIPTLSVGTVTFAVRDLRPRFAGAGAASPSSSIWEEHGMKNDGDA